MEKEITKSMPIFPALNKKRKVFTENSNFNTIADDSKSNKIFQILNIQSNNDKSKQSILTHRIRRFDLNRKTLFSKPKHQMTSSKQMIDTSLDPDDLSKTRPFSLEERNLNINDISFSRILRSDHTLSSLNTTRIAGGYGKPPSFYENDIKKWKDKFESAIKNRMKLKKVIDANTEETDSQRYALWLHLVEEKSNLGEALFAQLLLTLMPKETQVTSTICSGSVLVEMETALSLNLK